MSLHNKLKKIFDDLDINVPENLLQIALTHTSKTYEDKISPNYERLEFLGDAVLKLAISNELYKKFQNYNEGRMTKIRGILVADNYLYNLSKKIDLARIIILGKQEEKDGGRKKESIIACAFEAILGAVFLSSGLEKATLLINKIFENSISDVDKNLELYNAKALLQEYTQGLNKDLPQYIEEKETGEEHNKTFTYNVSYQGKILATGKGKTKKDAQQEAAKKACIKFGILKGTKNE